MWDPKKCPVERRCAGRAWASASATAWRRFSPPKPPVSRHDIAAISVAFFARWPAAISLLTGLGFGRGEIAAGLSNFRSIANILAPLLFAAAYNWGITPPRHFPKMIFVSRMVIGAVLPELTFRMVPLKVRAANPKTWLAGPELC